MGIIAHWTHYVIAAPIGFLVGLLGGIFVMKKYWEVTEKERRYRIIFSYDDKEED